jgi:hypothetical protein
VLVAEGLLWRATHLHAVGARLVDALGDSDETARDVAGMMLARGGHAAIPLLREALGQQRHVAQALTLLGDVGDATVEQEIGRFASASDADVARAAHGALRVLATRVGGEVKR